MRIRLLLGATLGLMLTACSVVHRRSVRITNKTDQSISLEGIDFGGDAALDGSVVLHPGKSFLATGRPPSDGELVVEFVQNGTRRQVDVDYVMSMQAAHCDVRIFDERVTKKCSDGF